MRKRILIVAALVLLAGAGGYATFSYFNQPKAAAASTTSTARVTRGNLTASVAGAGSVAAKKQVALNFVTSGTVKAVYVKLGDSVKAGQVLAEADATELQMSLANAQLSFNQQQLKYDQVAAGATESELADAREAVQSAQEAYDTAVRKFGQNDAQLLSLRNSLEKSRMALQKAESEYAQAVSERQTDLSTVSIALRQAQMDYEAAAASYRVSVENLNDESSVRSAARALANAKEALLTLEAKPSEDDLASARAQLEQARLSLQQAQLKMRNAQIVAPFDGTVTQVNVEADSGTSTTASGGAVQLSNLNDLQVTVNMAEVDISKIKAGQDVNLTFDALASGGTVAGKVTQIALVGTTSQGVVTYPVVITLTNPDPALIKTGMTANLTIIVDKRESVLLVPSRAIRTQGKQKVVQVQTSTGIATVPVTAGLTGDNYTEILSGVNEGDVVIVSGTTTTTNTRTGAPGGIGIPGAGPGF